MLLHGDRPLREYQEGVDGKPPYHLAARDRYRCINCGSKCHGHGWRTRYFCLYGGKSVRVWVHRLRCPGCGRTYTVIPGWAHARKVHGLSVILSVINAFLKEGHLVHGVCSWVDLGLRRGWVREFMKRHRKDSCGISIPERASPLPCVASGSYLEAVAERGDFLVLGHTRGTAHHKRPLLLLLEPL